MFGKELTLYQVTEKLKLVLGRVQNIAQSPKNPLVRSYLRVQNGQGRVIFLTGSSGRTSDNQKSYFAKYSIFSLNGESGTLQIFTRPNQILPDQNVTA